MKFFKKILARTFPALAEIYHRSGITRELQKHPIKDTPFGFKIAGNIRMQTGEFEPDEVKLLQGLAASIDCYIDVGANIGYFVCLMRSLDKKVLAIEPSRQNLDYLYGNIHANDWDDVEVFPIGLAENPSILTLYGEGTGASLVPNWAGASGAIKATIPVNTLDNVLGNRFDGKKLLIKIDVEGAELGVLKGATNILNMIPAPQFFIEICLTEHHPDGLNPDYVKVFQTLFDSGYGAYSMEADMRPVTLTDVESWFKTKTHGFGYANFFFEKNKVSL